MTKCEMAVEIASKLFGKKVGADNWKVRDLVRRRKSDLADLLKMADRVDFPVDRRSCGRITIRTIRIGRV